MTQTGVPKMIPSNGCTVCLLLLRTLLYPQLSADTEVIPRDFKIGAEYGSGGSVYLPDDFIAWKVTITCDGGVTQVIYPKTPAKNEVKDSTSLSAAELIDLLAVIKNADFFTLRGRYLQSFHEGPGLRLEITLNGKTHEVIVYRPTFQSDNLEVKRFLRVWSEVIKRVPPLKPDRKCG